MSIYTKNSETGLLEKISGETNIIVNEGAIRAAQPHDWPADGSEQDFGDGSFGRRFTGTVSVTTGAFQAFNLINNFSSVPNSRRLLSQGGWVNYNNDLLSQQAIGTAGLHGYTAYFFISGVGALAWIFQSAITVTNVPYDIWVRYTKN